LFQLSKNPHAGAIASGLAFVPLPEEIVKINLIYWESFFAEKPFASAIDLLGSAKIFCGTLERLAQGSARSVGTGYPLGLGKEEEAPKLSFSGQKSPIGTPIGHS
jgi:hypothetical protein